MAAVDTMDIHAYPTECTTPVTLAEAERLAERYLAFDADAGRGVTNRITEFDSCFVVVATFAPPAPTESRTPPGPLPIGGTVSTIDKASGAITLWPTYPPDVVAGHHAAAVQNGTFIVEETWPS
ncbi:hypothetical protein [Nocardia brasiliensis]|uniref:hypothetical protein n=1 Tax=Nocardia brasiliensis TaxID=37326 RepID=UPI0004A70849|nr:hypothetical protein [Nocardia brasiliensis]MBF6544854.1 hypothetical protein [Nocardia brasiliensis]